jgi:trk system potassium uptake protein
MTSGFFSRRRAKRPRLSRWDLSPHGSISYWRRLRSEQLFIASFLALILIGTLGLRLIPQMYAPGQAPLSWLDSLFTITSAVCVTGLAVVDTATCFSFLGQLWILIFIQLGGFGMIVLSSFIILALGGRLSLRLERLSSGTSEVAPTLNRLKLIRDIIVFTFVAEAVGAAALFACWTSTSEHAAVTLWHSVFHSVSAFCNAGFSTFPGGYTSQAGAPSTLLITAVLIIVGGIGFLALEDLYRRVKRPAGSARLRLSIHTRLVFTTSALLLVTGTLVYGALEWNNPYTLNKEGFSFVDRSMNALFMSASARTAGFNTIDYADAHAGTNFFTILLMTVGGSPGSTAGGVKTTTFALVVLLAWNRLRGEPTVSLWGRTLPEETIQRAVGLVVVVFGIITLFTLLMTTTENRAITDEKLLPLMFEVASAFNTTGLSMNVTPGLTSSGKWMDILMMFLGRVGPLTFAAAIALPEDAGDRGFRYAKEDVVIG